MSQGIDTYAWQLTRDEVKELYPLYGSLLTPIERFCILNLYGVGGRVALSTAEIATKRGVTLGSVSGNVKRGMDVMRVAAGGKVGAK